jgi:hypothetical protein
MLRVQELIDLAVKTSQYDRLDKLIKRKIELEIKLKTNPYFSYVDDLKKALIKFGYDCEIYLDVSDIIQVSRLPPNSSDYIYYIVRNSQYYMVKLHLQITIKFNEIKMTNVKETSYFIKDLFVRFNINTNGVIDSIKGTRSSISYEEFKTGYVHSHLPRSQNKLGYFNQFCLGSNSELITASVFFNESVNNKSNIDVSFLFFLNQLKAYVSYESLEGGPYIKIKDVLDKTRQLYKNHKTDYVLINTAATIYFDYFESKHNLNEIVKDCSALVNNVFIINELKLKHELFNENTIKTIVEDLYGSNDLNKFLLLIYNGKDISSNNKDLILAGNVNNEVYPIVFNNETITPEIKFDTLIDKSKIKYDLHSSFKNYAVQYVKNRYNRKTIQSLP